MRKRRIKKIENPQQYVGRVFGNITIKSICPQDADDIEQSCVCECNCGRTFTSPIWRVIANVQKSCGMCGSTTKPIVRPLPVRKNLVGQRFGELDVLQIAGRNTQNRITYLCRCSCGRTTVVASNNLTSGNTRSCGKCNYARQHGAELRLKYMTAEEQHLADCVYSSMKRRCYDPSFPEYKNYGARGIYMCAEWLADPLNYVNWCITNGWYPGMTVDRIDNDGPYAPWNCRLVSRFEQASNRRNNRNITVNGVTKTVTQWARDLGLSYGSLRTHTDEQIATTIHRKLSSI